MAGRENSPIDPADVLRCLKFPISAKQVGKRLGRTSSSVTHIIERHLSDQVESDLRITQGTRMARHYWRKDT